LRKNPEALTEGESPWGSEPGSRSKSGVATDIRHLRLGDIGADDPRSARSAAGAAARRVLWRNFLRQHAATTLACDFFTVEAAWLKRIYVLFFISLKSP
jgi:hypothetical protein